MAEGCRYREQLAEASRLVAAGVGINDVWRLVFQSRSGPPSQPWLEPDVNDALAELAADGVRDVVLVPIGFVSDHLEILYDLDTEARGRCKALGINMARAKTVGSHPRFVAMIRELILRATFRPARSPGGWATGRVSRCVCRQLLSTRVSRSGEPSRTGLKRNCPLRSRCRTTHACYRGIVLRIHRLALVKRRASLRFQSRGLL